MLAVARADLITSIQRASYYGRNVETAAENGAGSAVGRGLMLAHKDSIVLAEQKGIRSQVQYKQEFLGTLLTSDRIYGTKVARPESGFMMVVPD